MSAAPEHALNRLLRHPSIWRGGDRATVESVSTGFSILDRRLPGGGWPLGAVTELMTEHAGIGELGLIVPTLRRLARGGRGSAWVGPPHIPYAPALAARGLDPASVTVVRPRAAADVLWAAEQSLRSGVFGAVCLWPARPDDRCLRRLQLAAEHGNALALVFRSPRAAGRASPAALRLALEPDPAGLAVRLLKCRGSLGGGDRCVLTPDATAA